MAENLKVKISPLLLLSLRLLLLLSFADVYTQILQIFQNSQFDLEKNQIIHILSVCSRETCWKAYRSSQYGVGDALKVSAHGFAAVLPVNFVEFR